MLATEMDKTPVGFAEVMRGETEAAMMVPEPFIPQPRGLSATPAQSRSETPAAAGGFGR